MCAAASKSRRSRSLAARRSCSMRPAIGHVTNGRNDERTFVRLDRAETDVEWKLTAAPVPAAQVRTGPHRARHARLGVVVAMTVMLGTGLGGDQHLDRLTHEGIVGVPEHLLDQLVGVHDGASGVDDHSGIRRSSPAARVSCASSAPNRPSAIPSSPLVSVKGERVGARPSRVAATPPRDGVGAGLPGLGAGRGRRSAARSTLLADNLRVKSKVHRSTRPNITVGIGRNMSRRSSGGAT